MKTPEEITKEYIASHPPQPGKFHEFTTPSLESFVWRVQQDAIGELSSSDVIARLCSLCSEVAEKKFEWSEAADCVCDGRHHKCKGQSCGMFRFSKKVLEFVEAATREKLGAGRPPVVHSRYVSNDGVEWIDVCGCGQRDCTVNAEANKKS